VFDGVPLGENPRTRRQGNEPPPYREEGLGRFTLEGYRPLGGKECVHRITIRHLSYTANLRRTMLTPFTEVPMEIGTILVGVTITLMLAANAALQQALGPAVALVVIHLVGLAAIVPLALAHRRTRRRRPLRNQ
jgi:hypothetical protein